MGSDARVALYAPSTLLAYVSLPSTYGGSTEYYSTTTVDVAMSVISTAISGCELLLCGLVLSILLIASADTPVPFTQFTTYRELDTDVIYINPGATPSSATLPSA